MKRVVILLTLLIFSLNPAFSEVAVVESEPLPNIFIWAIPDDEDGAVTTEKQDKKNKKSKEKNEEISNEDIEFTPVEEEAVVLKTTTLKGYTEFIEDAEDVLYMDDYTKFTLDIRTPQMIADEHNMLFNSNQKIIDKKLSSSFSKFKAEEYRVSSNSAKFEDSYKNKYGKWSYGTTFDTESTTLGQLENTTSLFTKYDSKYFSLKSSYKKNNMTVSQIQTDNFSVVPELKFNNIFSISEVLSADITRNRRSGEFVLSVNPLGNRDIDRVRLQVGAKTTQDLNSGRTWSQLEFSTKFKL